MGICDRGLGQSLLLFCLMIPPGIAGAVEVWPEFRGPQGDGHADDSNPPWTWSETENVRWKMGIPGKGWSSPVVWQNQIWVTTATEDGKEMSVVCLERQTGVVLHERVLFRNDEPRFCHPTNSYASPTPVVTEKHVYAHFGSYGTACLNRKTADTVWQRRDLPCDHFRGPGSSPILFDGRLYVAFDGHDLQYQVALDAATGATVWKVDRQIDYGSDDGDYRKAYGTCTVIEVDGSPQLISPSAAETIAYEPRTGTELWRIRHGGMNAATRPLFAHGLVYLTTGDAVGSQRPSLLAVRPDGPFAKHPQWVVDQGAPRRSSPIIVGDYLFLVRDEGIASCLNAKTGESLWQKRLGGTYRASPVCAGDRLYFFNLEGQASVLRASPQWELLAVNRLDEGCQASPAIVGDSLIVRTTTHLYCIESLDGRSPGDETTRSPSRSHPSFHPVAFPDSSASG